MTNHKSPDPKPKPGKLANAEVAALAGDALKAWESGVLVEHVDSTGPRWSFLPERDPTAGLRITRTGGEDEPAREAFVSQRELGVDEVKPRLASIVLALSEPA